MTQTQTENNIAMEDEIIKTAVKRVRSEEDISDEEWQTVKGKGKGKKSRHTSINETDEDNKEKENIYISKNKSKNCQISQVRITPCDNPDDKCTVARGTTASLSVDFTPNFATSNLKAIPTSRGFPFPGMDDDACKVTSCPTIAGVSQTLDTSLHISNKFPKGIFPVMWKLWNADNEKEELCCFSTTIQIE